MSLLEFKASGSAGGKLCCKPYILFGHRTGDQPCQLSTGLLYTTLFGVKTGIPVVNMAQLNIRPYWWFWLGCCFGVFHSFHLDLFTDGFSENDTSSPANKRAPPKRGSVSGLLSS